MTESDPAEGEAGALSPVPVGGAGAEGSLERGALAAVDEEAFGRFYRTYFARLTAYLVYQGARVDVAAELVQDTMFKAYERWGGIRSPRNWAYKVVYQAFIRYATRVEEEPVEVVPEPSAVLPRPGEADAWVQEQEVVRVVGVLPPRQRQVLALTLDGWEPADIAELLGIEGAAVRASLLKARRAVALYLARGEGE